MVSMSTVMLASPRSVFSPPPPNPNSPCPDSPARSRSSAEMTNWEALAEDRKEEEAFRHSGVNRASRVALGLEGERGTMVLQ